MALAPKPSAMQIKTTGDRKRRSFNPDRDLVWAMGRMVKRLGLKLGKLLHNKSGDIKPGAYMDLLRENGIYAPDGFAEQHTRYFKEFITAVNAYFQRLHGNMEEEKNKITEPLPELYEGRQYAAARSLFSVMLVREIFSEHPYWWAQVQPQSDTDPQPRIKEINDAVRTILGTPESE